MVVEKDDGLTQYVRRLFQSNPIDSFDLPLNVTPEPLRQRRAFFHYEMCYGSSIELLLDWFPFNAVLLGPPGAGKSHALRSHLVRSAEVFFGERFRPYAGTQHSVVDRFSIPVFIDLKRYCGSIEALLSPPSSSIDLATLIESQRVGFVVDSFNEAPREYRENGRLQSDLEQWISTTGSCRWLIASRSSEGLDFFKGERFHLSGLEPEFVDAKLIAKSIELRGRYQKDMMQVLCNPFFMSAFLAGRLDLRSADMHPAQAMQAVLSSYFDELAVELRFNPKLSEGLGPIAHSSVDSGQETFNRQDVIASIEHNLPKNSLGVGPKIVDRLVAAGFFVEFGEERIGFYHQSITELIAAKFVAVRVESNQIPIASLLESRRSDETWRWMTYFLSSEKADELIRYAMERDFVLAMRLIQRCPHDCDILINQVLIRIIQLSRDEVNILDGDRHELRNAFILLPVTSAHVEPLLKLRDSSNVLAGEAVRLLMKLRTNSSHALADGATLDQTPSEVVDETNEQGTQYLVQSTVDRVFQTPDDYGIGQDAGLAMAKVINEDWVGPVFDRILKLDASLQRCQGIEQFVTEAFRNFNPETIVAEFRVRHIASSHLPRCILEWAQQQHDEHSTSLLIDLVIDGVPHAVFSLYLSTRSTGHLADIWSTLDESKRTRFKEVVLESLNSGDECCYFYVDFVRVLSNVADDLAQWRETLIENHPGTLALAILALDQDRRDEFWDYFRLIFDDPQRQFTDQEYELLKVFHGIFPYSMDWSGHESQFLELTQRQDFRLMKAIINRDTYVKVELSWERVGCWLQWLINSPDSDHFIKYELAPFVADQVDAEFRTNVVAEFNRTDSPLRRVIAELLPILVDDIDRSEISGESIDFLIEQLHAKRIYDDKTVLAEIADADLVEKLKAKLEIDTEPFRQNLRFILNAIGQRHGKRYV